MKTETGTQTVRHQLGLGRLLPLGGPDERDMVTEEAAQPPGAPWLGFPVSGWSLCA